MNHRLRYKRALQVPGIALSLMSRASRLTVGPGRHVGGCCVSFSGQADGTTGGRRVRGVSGKHACAELNAMHSDGRDRLGGMRIVVLAAVFVWAFGCTSMKPPPPAGTPHPAPENKGQEEASWAESCRTFLANSVKTLGGSWGYPELAGGTLRVERNVAGTTSVTYTLELSSGEKYLVEVASVRPDLPDRAWQDQDGGSPEPAMFHGEDPWPPGEIVFRKDHGGHRGRIFAKDDNILRRHSFAAAFMTAVDYCVGEHANMFR